MANKISCIQLGNIVAGKNWDNPQAGRVYSVDGLAPTLNTCGGGNREPKILETKERKKDIADRNKEVRQYSPHFHERQSKSG